MSTRYVRVQELKLGTVIAEEVTEANEEVNEVVEATEEVTEVVEATEEVTEPTTTN